MAFYESIAARANGYPGLVGPWGEPIDRGTSFQPRTGYDGFAIPHTLNFASMVGSLRGYWRDRYDEALKFARDAAQDMEHDTTLMGPLQERMLAVVSLPGHVHVPNEKDPVQKFVKDHITKALEGMVGPEESILKLRMNLLWGLWFGRQGAKAKWAWTRQDGVKTLTLADWQPLRGDKISHLKDGTPAVDIYAASGEYEFPDADITTTTNGARALVLQGDMSWGWRSRVLIHRHELVDADFFDAEAAEAIFGLGIRSRVFWLDWISREWLARVSDFVDRVGLGVTLWYYDASNPQALAIAQTNAKTQTDRANIFVPRFGTDKRPAVERVEVPTGGAEMLLRLRQDIREVQRLYIVGQTMSTGGSKQSGGDMGGSHRARLAADTKDQIRNFDARNLDATITGSMVHPGLISMIQYHTFPSTWPSERNPNGFRASWVTDLEADKSGEKVEAGIKVMTAGVALKADELRGAAGYSKPTEGDETVGGAQPIMPGGPGDTQAIPQPATSGQAEETEDEPSPDGKTGEDATPPAPQSYAREEPVQPDEALWQAILAILPQGRPVKLPTTVGEVGGVKVTLVDGAEVMLRKRHKGKPHSGRDFSENDFMDFDVAGNWVEDPELCDENEVYVDALVDPSQWAFNAYHELGEARKMLRLMAEGVDLGKAYEKAHEEVNREEKMLRERARAESYARQDYDRGGEGRWITIGGKNGADGKRHGGSPVYVEGGRITKGHPSLTGKKISALDEAAEVGSHRKELKQSRAYARAKVAKEAKQEGIEPAELHQLAAEVLSHDKAYKDGLTAMLQDARKHARRLGSDLTTLKARAAKGIDADAVRGLDDVAQSMEASYPEFFGGRGTAEEQLFDHLVEGNPEPMSEDEAYKTALAELRHYRGKPVEEPIEEPVPFMRQEPETYPGGYVSDAEFRGDAAQHVPAPVQHAREPVRPKRKWREIDYTRDAQGGLLKVRFEEGETEEEEIETYAVQHAPPAAQPPTPQQIVAATGAQAQPLNPPAPTEGQP
jgi:hypothetical protein